MFKLVRKKDTTMVTRGPTPATRCSHGQKPADTSIASRRTSVLRGWTAWLRSSKPLPPTTTARRLRIEIQSDPSGPLVVPFYPTKIDYRKRVPYSNLSTGGPSFVLLWSPFGVGNLGGEKEAVLWGSRSGVLKKGRIAGSGRKARATLRVRRFTPLECSTNFASKL